MNRRWLYLAAAALALSMIVGTGGFSTASAERGVEVAVVPDEHAYLGIETEATQATVGETVEVLELEDNFASDVDVDDVRIVRSTAPVDLQRPTGATALDETAPVSVSCDGVGDGKLTFEITASGSGVDVVATKTIPMSCTPPPLQPSDVTFIGCGNAEIHGHQAHFPLEVTLLGYNGGGVTATTVTVQSPGDVTGGSAGQLIGVLLGDLPVTNPNYDFDRGSCGNASNGNPAAGEPGDPREQVN